MEEGQSKAHLRGGGGSVDTVEQEKDYYRSKPPKKNKKKLCKFYRIAFEHMRC
jgi:glucan 1,3-beta-glucosidase